MIAKGFREFIQEQGIVGIGVAFVLGAAVTKLVGAFVADFVNPVLTVVLRVTGGLSSATLNIGSVKLLYGSFISSLIDFLIVALVIYWAFNFFRLDRLCKKPE